MENTSDKRVINMRKVAFQLREALIASIREEHRGEEFEMLICAGAAMHILADIRRDYLSMGGKDRNSADPERDQHWRNLGQIFQYLHVDLWGREPV
ncbi:MAG: hypothetical protein BWY04_01080 [candidate division CPR1 bacterium ADurb.Bin160]|uniref:Uncharacterized protein n=1 Tax=candidate division CPR1 bacterium ADurb.Bin160 TaxID=1852826 RepID=A0A1V5ZLD0_9BACT|nr:MAG: hypothetical protein BWY04_01080 [candidate division CPR1 bacterium ADurb.Bin160]